MKVISPFILLITLVLSFKVFSASLNFSIDKNGVDFIRYVNEDKSCGIQNKNCIKEVSPCLNCSGSKKFEILNFFKEVGEIYSSCLESPIDSVNYYDYFNNLSFHSFNSYSSLNPGRLDDPKLRVKFAKLCPLDTTNLNVLLVVDSNTYNMEKIAAVSCDGVIFPLKRKFYNSCQDNVDFLNKKTKEIKDKKLNIKKQLEYKDFANVSIDLIKFSEFLEAEYIECDQTSFNLCLNICDSMISCTINNISNVASFRSPLASVDYLKDEANNEDFYNLLTKEHFVFSGSSLNLNYLIDYKKMSDSTDDFGNFDDIDNMLNDFSDIFTKDNIKNASEGSFIVSESYRSRVQKELNNFCEIDEEATLYSIVKPYIKFTHLLCKNKNSVKFYNLRTSK